MCCGLYFFPTIRVGSRKWHVISTVCGGSLVGEDASTVMAQMSRCKHGRGFHVPFSGNMMLGARKGKHGSQ